MLGSEQISGADQSRKDLLLRNVYSRPDIHPAFLLPVSSEDVSFIFDKDFFDRFPGLNIYESFVIRQPFSADAQTQLIFPYETDFSEQSNVHIARFSKAVTFLLFALRRYAKNTISQFDLTQRLGVAPGSTFEWVFQVGDMSDNIPHSIAYQRRKGFQNICLFPDEYFMTSLAYAAFRDEVRSVHVPWKERKPQAFWRGSSTGLLNLTMADLPRLPRYQLCAVSCAHPDLLDAGITDVVQALTPNDHKEIHESLIEQGLFKGYVPQSGMIQYKYLVDIDGNANSWGLFNKFLMGSCVLKVSSDWEEWYYKDMQPWIHYVPVSADMSDLAEKVVWCQENDNKAERIAKNGMEFAAQMTIDTETRKIINEMFKSRSEGAS